MVVKDGNGLSICTLVDGELSELDGSRSWSVWMKRVRNLADNTIRTFARSMDRFWQWSLFNPPEENESFTFYLARYRDDLRKGFVLEETVEDKRFGSAVLVPVMEVPPLTKQTVNREMAGIRSFFFYSELENLLYDQRYINYLYLYEWRKSSRSVLSSMQVRKSRWILESSGAKMPFVAPYRQVHDRRKIKYFPMELFDELLEVAKPRDRLICLLCGACSARIGQALNLTLYDIDYDRKKVWLIDPKGDYWPEIDWVPRKRWLREEYGIDMDGEGPHNKPDLQFKYPIPREHEALYWLNEEKYLNWFFDTLTLYTLSREYMDETVRHPRHPFFFVTRNGNRVHARETLSRFKRNLRTLVDEGPEIMDLGLHSLRHIFGHAMAELYAATGNEALVSITQTAMGHSSIHSTLRYFSLSEATLRRMIGEASTKIL